MPFVCPTCGGTGRLVEPGQPDEECPTCHWAGTVDPANSPVTFLGKIRKMFFGG
jgi:DnaJ-class molecular chaperone